MAPAPQEAHQHQPGMAHRGAEVVVNLGRMGQSGQVQTPQFDTQQIRLPLEQLVYCQQVGVGAAEQQHGRRRLFNQRSGICGPTPPWYRSQAMHDAILQGAVRRSKPT